MPLRKDSIFFSRVQLCKTLGWQNKTNTKIFPPTASPKSLLICGGQESRIAPFKDRNIQMKKF